MKLLIVITLAMLNSFAFAKGPAIHEKQVKALRGVNPGATLISLEDQDFTACLKSLNDETVVWKDKIFPLDPKGHTFLVKSDNNTMFVVGTKASYILTEKPDCTTRIDADPLAKIQQLYNTVAPKDAISKKAVIEKCKYLPLAFQPEGAAMNPPVTQ